MLREALRAPRLRPSHPACRGAFRGARTAILEKDDYATDAQRETRQPELLARAFWPIEDRFQIAGTTQDTHDLNA